MMKKQWVKVEWYFLYIIILLAMVIFLYAPYREKEVFNKFKDPNQPNATYLDAVFSKLRVTTK